MQINKYSYRLFFFFTILFVPFLLLGQTIETPAKNVGLGIKIGANYSSLNSSLPIQSTNSDILPSYGLIFSYTDKKVVGIQLEINYIQKSWIENPILSYQFESKLDYLEIPMLTTFHFGNRLKFIVNFGPYLSILLNKESNHNVAEDSEYYDYYEYRNAKGGDFGLLGGAGLRFRNKLGIFQLEGRYSYGFQNLYSSKETKLSYSNLMSFGLHLSYQFTLVHEP